MKCCLDYPKSELTQSKLVRCYCIFETLWEFKVQVLIKFCFITKYLSENCNPVSGVVFLHANCILSVSSVLVFCYKENNLTVYWAFIFPLFSLKYAILLAKKLNEINDPCSCVTFGVQVGHLCSRKWL